MPEFYKCTHAHTHTHTHKHKNSIIQRFTTKGNCDNLFIAFNASEPQCSHLLLGRYDLLSSLKDFVLFLDVHGVLSGVLRDVIKCGASR